MLSKAKALTLTKSFRSAVLGHNIRFHEESTCLKAAVPEVNSLGSESMVCAETRYEVAHSCTRFPCFLGMEINAKTQWTTTKIVQVEKSAHPMKVMLETSDFPFLSLIVVERVWTK